MHGMMQSLLGGSGSGFGAHKPVLIGGVVPPIFYYLVPPNPHLFAPVPGQSAQSCGTYSKSTPTQCRGSHLSYHADAFLVI